MLTENTVNWLFQVISQFQLFELYSWVFYSFRALILNIVFPIIGGIKANDGELWEYPLTIKFLK